MNVSKKFYKILGVSLGGASFFFPLSARAEPAQESRDDTSLFRDLATVEEIDKRLKDELPFFYNYSFVGGYFNMPSARMAQAGTLGFGGGSVPPYRIYGVNFQVMDRIELSGNYRIFNGMIDKGFGKEGFGDEAERIGNIKIALILPKDGGGIFPEIAIGADDFFGTKRFHAQYCVVTKRWVDQNIEFSLGWGKGRFKGPFGGIAWTPFRQMRLPFLQGLSFLAEYDAINYKKHISEHAKGRSVKTRINAGINYLVCDALQLSLSSIRGEKIGGSASLRYPLGTTKGFFPKIDNPLSYSSPVDTEPLGVSRPERDFVHELAYAFADQGLDLYTAWFSQNSPLEKRLWLKVVNNRYREESEVRGRIQHLLAALSPSDISYITVVVEADALPSHAYCFRRQDLRGYLKGSIGEFELETLVPMREAPLPPREEEGAKLLFQRKKEVWTFTLRPRLLTYFGSSKGKFKYNLGIIASPEGYLFDECYYKIQLGYSIKSSMLKLGDRDRLNPSRLPNVRSDTIRYFQSNTVSLEQAYIQKGWNLRKGWFYRLATGYFEPAYGGIATEFLYYPVNSSWAIGVEAASVLKRRYQGIAFTRKIRQFKGDIVHMERFIGIQYFLDLYYDFKPLSLEFKISAGQFLAKDKGVRTEVGRYFPSGVKFALWYTWTNGHDVVNGKRYYDKGFSFTIPLDFFLKQSSRNYVGYAMAAWLRDVGAKAETGKQLYTTLSEERYGRR